MIGEQVASFCESNAILRPFFGGVIGLDSLKGIKKQGRQTFFVVNVDKTSSVGSHWFTVLRVAKGHFELFDSLGVSQEQVRDRLGRIAGNCSFNTARFQAPGSTTCGKFSVFFAFVRLCNHDESFHEVIATYFKVNDFAWNERHVDAWWTHDELTAVHD